MSMIVRAKVRFASVLDGGMHWSCSVRTYVGIESLPRCCYINGIVRHSRYAKALKNYRNQSSARPLPNDVHEDHTWMNGEEMRIRPPSKRASTVVNIQQRHANLRSSVLTVPSPNNIQTDTFSEHWATEKDAHIDNGSNSIGLTESDIIDSLSLAAQPTLPWIDPIDNLMTESPATIEFISPSSLRYTGDAVIPITSLLHIVKPQEDTPRGVWPVFRLLDENGVFRNPCCDGFENNRFEPMLEDNRISQHDTNQNDDLLLLRSKLSDMFPYQAHEINSSGLLRSAPHPYFDTNSTNSLLRASQQLLRLRTMDTILQNAQRQGRISFYMTCTGEEAIHIGSASALTNQDPIFAQYREQGLLMWRGFTLEQFTNQCFSNDRDLGKGRQMPIHYGSRALNYHTVSSPLGTQLPQAVGAAYRLKLMKKPNVAICFFGDGCASTTDFHAALNFAATLSAPVIFFCRNNGYAISTPVSDQYAGDGIVSRATGYGMAAIRVDGNDIFAVHAAVREAKKYALQHSAPVLIEGMTYRLGHHSTSDDSTRYRSEKEVIEFSDRMDPFVRLNLFLQHHDLTTDAEIEEMKDKARLAVLDAIKQAEKRPKPNIDSMFTDVYKEMPLHLQKQLEALKQHVAKYPDKY